jgi:hypothetical protein
MNSLSGLDSHLAFGSQSLGAHSLLGMRMVSTSALHVTDQEPCCQISTYGLHVTDRRRAELGSKRGEAATESVLWGVLDIYRTREYSDFGVVSSFYIQSYTHPYSPHTSPQCPNHDVSRLAFHT